MLVFWLRFCWLFIGLCWSFISIVCDLFVIGFVVCDIDIVYMICCGLLYWVKFGVWWCLVGIFVVEGFCVVWVSC